MVRRWGLFFLFLIIVISGCTTQPYANFFISMKCSDCKDMRETMEVCESLNQKYIDNGVEPLKWEARVMTPIGKENSDPFYLCKLNFRLSDKENASALADQFKEGGVLYYNITK